MGLSDPCFGKIALYVFGFSKTDRRCILGCYLVCMHFHGETIKA
jgi:hypothetical protein